MASKKHVINIEIPSIPGETSPGPSSPTPGSLSKRTKEELWLPVVYHSVAAEVQNEIDRLMSVMEVSPDRHKLSTVSTAESQDAIELINQLSIQRKQARDFQRRLSLGIPASKLEKEPSTSPLPSPTTTPPVRTKSVFNRMPSLLPKISQVKAPVIDVAKEAQSDDHLVPLEVLEKRFDTSMKKGLTEHEVQQRRQRDGKNTLSPQKSTPAWLAFMKCVVGGFGFILLVAFVLCILAYQPLGDPPDIYNIVLAVVILAVIIVQAVFFFIQERRSTNLMASFRNLLPANCLVLRDSNWKTVEASELVVGDIVRLKAGDKVPADIRLFEVVQAKVEKSSLTGESEPIPLTATSADSNLYETKNVALFGTSILEGTAAGIVFNTGDRTIMAKIARVASTTSTATTSLQKELNYFTGVVACMAAIVCLIVVGGYYGFVEPKHPKYLTTAVIVTNCIAVVVAVLPDGAPVALAMNLTLIAKRMYSAKILVKKLTVLETLGSATLIASDKTGTLTQNHMTLNHLWILNDYKGGRMEAEEAKKKNPALIEEKQFDQIERSVTGCFSAQHIARNLSESALYYLCQIMALCNKTVFETQDYADVPKFQRARSVQRKCIGNPTESALLLAADEFFDVERLRSSVPIVDEIAFTSRTKYHLTVHKVSERQLLQNSAYSIGSSDGGAAFNYLIFVKGAPEYLLGACTRVVMNGEEVEADSTTINRVMHVNELMGGQGERVLGFAYRKLYSKEYPDNYRFDMDDEDRWMSGLCFLGLAGIIDPPRDGVADSVDACHGAHVRVMMITGDQPTTAVAVARSVNIITHKSVKTINDIQNAVPYSPEDEEIKPPKSKLMSKLKHLVQPIPKRHFRDESIVVAGNEITQLTPKQWDFVLEHKEVVFARMTPEQKLQIVKESRKRGDIVAVTGDGVNDAPALKAADLGVAMGICGSDVSKEAANMILLDDNFITIVNGIKEGRLLFNNLKKVICYLFPSGSFSEILPVFASVFLGMPMPLSSFLMIVICIGTDMIGSLGLIHEYAESDMMRQPPRNPRKDRLVNARTILFAYFFMGVLESSIAFFMYFFTMWHVGGIHPNQIVGAFNSWSDGINGTYSTWIPGKTIAELNELNELGQTAFFVSLVMTQLWNLLAVRTRYQSIFKQKFQTKLLYYMAAEVVIVIFTCYLPIVNKSMKTKPAEWYHFIMPLGMGSVILIGDEMRKFLVRKYPKGILAKLAW